jgi:hypothetical protein
MHKPADWLRKILHKNLYDGLIVREKYCVISCNRPKEGLPNALQDPPDSFSGPHIHFSISPSTGAPNSSMRAPSPTPCMVAIATTVYASVFKETRPWRLATVVLLPSAQPLVERPSELLYTTPPCVARATTSSLCLTSSASARPFLHPCSCRRPHPNEPHPGVGPAKGKEEVRGETFFGSSSKSLQSSGFVTTLEEELFFSIVWQCFARNHSQRGRRSCAKVTLTRSYFLATTASSYSSSNCGLRV